MKEQYYFYKSTKLSFAQNLKYKFGAKLALAKKKYFKSIIFNSFADNQWRSLDLFYIAIVDFNDFSYSVGLTVITFYSPSCLGLEIAKGPFGLRVKLPPMYTTVIFYLNFNSIAQCVYFVSSDVYIVLLPLDET